MALAVACAPAAPAGLSDADRAAIRQAEDQWVQLTSAKDWEGAAKAYLTEDGKMLPPNGPALNGQAAVAGWLAGYPPFSDFSLEDVTVEGRGDLAYVHGRYSLMVTPPGAAAPIRDQGKHVTIFKKQADGTWKATVGIFNSDLPLPAAGPVTK
jgi:ketosteroid isomerase-like protein